MATLNVFEVTNAELSKALKESKAPVAKKANKKTVKESAKKIKSKYNKIAANKIKLESMQFVIEAEDNDEVIDYTPDEDVVLVIDPEMDETPADVEEAQEEAEDIVGDYVCKCSICGANYLCDCEEVKAMEEDLEEAEAECPVCGEVGEQIIVGEITPAEEVTTDEDEAEETETEDEVEVEDEVDVEDDFDDVDDGTDVNIDINVDGDGVSVEADEEEDYEESIQRAKRRTMLRRESAKRARMARKSVAESKRSAKILPRKRPTMESKVVNKLSAKRPLTRKTVKESAKGINVDETTLNRMLTKFAKENYGNVRMVKINKGSLRNGKLTLEGVVVTTKGSRRTTKFVCENFKASRVVSAKFTEMGAFTESATTKKNAFTINFVNKNNVYTPTALTYNYNVRENKEAFKVSGKVVNESLRKNRK